MMQDNPLDVDRIFGKNVPLYKEKAEPRRVDLPMAAEKPDGSKPAGLPAQAQVVYDIFDRIHRPTGGGDVHFPVWKVEPLDGYTDSGKGGFVAGLDKYQAILLGQLISEKTGETYKLLKLQQSYDLAQRGDWFRDMITKYWIHNREFIVKGMGVAADPEVEILGEKLVFRDKIIGAQTEEKVAETMVNAGLFGRTTYKVSNFVIDYENSVSSVCSSWDGSHRLFNADANKPSHTSPIWIAAYISEEATV